MAKPLIYTRPGPDGLELCIQDGDTFKIYPLTERKVLQLLKELMKGYEGSK